MLTKGAIGNLINRYRAVLEKCRLMNVFGSLAVASMLVMGGAGMAGAEQIENTDMTGGNISGDNLVVSKPVTSYSGTNGEYANVAIRVSKGENSINATESLTFESANKTTNDPNQATGTGHHAVVVTNGASLNITTPELFIGTEAQGGDRGIRLTGTGNKLNILADRIISYTGDEFVHVRGGDGTSVANIGTAENPIKYFEAHTGWGKGDYGVAILQANEGNTINFFADEAHFDGPNSPSGGVFGSGSKGTVNINTKKLDIDGNICGAYGTQSSAQYDNDVFTLNVKTDDLTMKGNINVGTAGEGYNTGAKMRI